MTDFNVGDIVVIKPDKAKQLFRRKIVELLAIKMRTFL